MSPQGVASQCIVIAAMMTLCVSSSAQALEISVRGGSEMTLDVNTAGTTIAVEGSLRDDLGDALPERGVEVAVRRGNSEVFSQRVYTNFVGGFSAAVELEPGRYEVGAEFRDTDHVTGASRVESVAVEAAPTELMAVMPVWVHGAETAVPVQIRASAGGRGLSTAASLMINDSLAVSVELDGDGWASVDVSPYLRSGENKIIVEVPDTEYRDRAVDQGWIRRVDKPEISGEMERVFLRLVRGVEVEVDLRDEAGAVVGADVEFRFQLIDDSTQDDDPPVALVESGRTGTDGRAKVVFPDRELGTDAWQVSARISPGEGEDILWKGETWQHKPSPWIPWFRFLTAVVLAAGLLWISRRGIVAAWAKIKEMFGGQDEVVEDEIDTAVEVFQGVEEVSLRSMPESPGADVEMTNKLGIQVWNEWHDEPVARATVVVEGDDGESREFHGSQTGVIKVPELEQGVWTLHAEAPGFVAARARVTVPVRVGTLRLVMTPVPLKIRRAYRWMMERTRGEDQWGRLTPRQIEKALRRVEAVGDETPHVGGENSQWRTLLEGWEDCPKSERVDVLLRAITEVVEETNFSGQQYDRELWEAMRGAFEELADGLEKSELNEADRGKR